MAVVDGRGKARVQPSEKLPKEKDSDCFAICNLALYFDIPMIQGAEVTCGSSSSGSPALNQSTTLTEHADAIRVKASPFSCLPFYSQTIQVP